MLLLAALALPAAAALDAATARVARGDEAAPGTEIEDRNVDSAALDAEDNAISDLQELLKKYRGQAQESALLYRYADAYQTAADMRFRIAHGRAQKTGQPLDLSDYRKTLKASIAPLNELIAQHPKFNDIGHAYFMRAKALDNTDSKKAASRDYLVVVKRFSGSDDEIPAYMALANIEMDAKHNERALDYLKKVEARTGDSHYPIALYDMAWSYFLLGRIGPTLSTSEKLLAFLQSHETSNGTERAMLENLQRDIPRFYFAAYEKQIPGHGVKQALPYFQRYAKQPELGKLLVQFAYLLRTHELEPELVRWKNIVLAAYPDQADSHEVLLATYEYQLSQGDYHSVAVSAQDIAKVARGFHDTEAAAKAEKLLSDSTTALQRLLRENRNPRREAELTQDLAAVYGAFSQLVKDGDPRLRTFHFNLAETLFGAKDFEQAAVNYRWILDHGGFDDKRGKISGADASLKAISSRYEQLRAAKFVPESLTARALTAKDTPADARINEWLSWIDEHVSHLGRASIDNFQFEADRVLYARGQMRESLKRLRELALGAPKSSFAIPAATLILDTYIASSEWDRVEQCTNEFLAIDAWKGTAFAKRVYKVASDSKFKHAELMASKRDYKDAIAQADELEKQYPQSEHLADALTLAGNAAVKMNNRELAIHYYSKLADQTRDAQKAAQSRLSIAQLEEERFNFVGAASAYLAYLKLPARATHLDKNASSEMRRRILLFAWLGGNAEQLGKLASSKALCTGSLAAECQKYQVLRLLMAGSVPVKTSLVAARNASRAAPRLRGIWATIALENADHLSWSERHRLVQVLAANWEGIDSMSRFSLIPRIAASVPQVFALDRASVAKATAKIALNQSSIKYRLRLLADMEASATQAAKLPWIRVRALVLNEMAASYAGLTDSIRALPVPKRLSVNERRAYFKMVDQLVAPFEQKTLAIRSEAYRLVSNAAVERPVYDTVADAMFRTAGRYGRNNGVPRQRNWAELDLDLVRSVDPHGQWSSVNYDTAEASQVLRSRWAQALEGRNWRQVAFFVNEASVFARKSLIPAGVIDVARAASLAAAGARAEGALALSDACHSSRRESIREACSGRGATLASLEGGAEKITVWQ